jgi:uncharacterized protein GlcG (DUF336 family)
MTPMSGPRLTLDQANAIITQALRHARSHNLRALAVVVVDADGHLVAAQREDGATMFRIDIAYGKAWTATAFATSSRAVARRAKDNPTFFGALAATANGRFLPQQGAALIRDRDGTVLGAAGASGDTGDQDEASCAAGIEAIGLLADIGP